MKNRLYFLLSSLIFLPLVLQSAQSVEITSACNFSSFANCAIVQLPASSPWTTLGQNSQRWEYRIHNMTAGAGPIALGPFKIIIGGGVIGITSNTLNPPNVDSLGATVPSGQPLCCGAFTDVLVRLQRDVPNLSWNLTLCATQNFTQCTTVTNAITSLGTNTNWTNYLFAPGAGYRISHLRWFSTLVATTTTIRNAGVTGDLADWEFEGTLVDSVSGLTFAGVGATVTYTTTPTYVPSCDTGTQQSFKTGIIGFIDGSKSQALDGGTTLNAVWTYAGAGTDGITQSMLSFGNANLITTTINGLSRGSVNLTLTLTDASLNTNNCTIHNGAVTVTANDIVVTGLTNTEDIILGQLLRLGSPYNRSLWYDNRNVALAVLQGGAQAANVPIYWNTFATGTVAVSPTATCGGSTAGKGLVGTGTSFTALWPTPDANSYITIAWNAGVNRRNNIIDTVISDTCAILHYAWDGGTTESGLNFVVPSATAVDVWGFDGSASPQNYYDNVKAFKSLYRRSGIDTYWTYYITLADRFWAMPSMDQGQSYIIAQQSSFEFVSRNQSMEGMFLRSMDAGMSSMWTGIRVIINFDILSFLSNVGRWTIDVDSRDTAYSFMFIAYDALFDPDTAQVTTSKNAIINGMTNIYPQGVIANGSFPTAQYMIVNTTQSVNVVNGSATVTINGGGSFTGLFPTTAPWFVTYNNFGTPFTGTTCANSGFNSTVYLPTVVNATTINLNTPYLGTTGTVGWARDADSGSVDNRYPIGCGAQPFMEGIQTTAFFKGGLSIAVVDPTRSALAYTYGQGLATWLRTRAYANPAYSGVGGMYYYQDFLVCAFPTQTTACTTNYDANQSRTDAAEVLRGFADAYNQLANPTLRTFGNTIYDEMYCKPNYGGTCTSDGFYINGLDDSGTFMSSDPASAKWLGFFFGYSAGINWAALDAVAVANGIGGVTGGMNVSGRTVIR